ncbi:MAG TPA: SPASM domain-containing protein, partial [Elusimicrobiales bacterium]|nr:SPASM domain-containing protein [Elusimicrobiales bacterium]
LLISLDGITQATYAKYRRGGDLRTVLDNIRAVLAARKRLGLRSPHVVWQFLVFKHNQHELRDAVALAKELGVDQLMIKGGYVPPEPALTDEWKTTLEDIGEFRGCSADRDCLWPWGGININADGSATLCYIDPKSYCRAEDFGREFPRVWNGEPFRLARRTVRLLREGKLKPDSSAATMCGKCHAFGSVNYWI